MSNLPSNELQQFRAEIGVEMQLLLQWWADKMVDSNQGGFYGRIDGFNQLQPEADKGVILNTRLLWTFSAAAQQAELSGYRQLADRAYQYLLDYFWDEKAGCVFWTLDFRGQPTQMIKQVYAQAFAIYGFTEYYALTGQTEALERAQAIFQLIEEHSRDREKGGYRNVCGRHWEPLTDQRLSDKDENRAKIMNTHLHLMEAYANLHRVAPTTATANALQDCLVLMLDKFCDRHPRHLYLYFDDHWQASSAERSFGHDIETAWLLVEAAEILDSTALMKEVVPVALELAQSTLDRGLDPRGGVYENTDHSGQVPVAEKHWWPQAEAIVGFIQAYQLSGEQRYWQEALKCWSFIKAHFRDSDFGEWHWMIDTNHKPILDQEDKAGPWKAPYHNVRMCLEVLRRLPE
ncbi:MAG: AGE family epimerase/isomerase [Bacteroidota bacterium]